MELQCERSTQTFIPLKQSKVKEWSIHHCPVLLLVNMLMDSAIKAVEVLFVVLKVTLDEGLECLDGLRVLQMVEVWG